jgi:citrate lyase subunit beta/citryl-CoA lyase
VLPKVSGAAAVLATARQLADRAASRELKLIAQIEDVESLLRLDEIAVSSPNLLGMHLGSEDFAASAGMVPCSDSLLYPMQAVVFACRRHGLLPYGYPGSIATYGDPTMLRNDLALARRIGCVGAFCIHPSQVALLNEAFRPSAEEIAHAKAVVLAHESAGDQGLGATQVDGRMVDAPIVRQARELLWRAEQNPN